MIMLIVKAAIVAALFITISDIMYAIECRLCELIAFLNKVFEMFAGLQPILYTPEVGKIVYDPATGGAQQVIESADYYEETTLIQMIFGNSTINVIYWNMALIGIAMVIGFAIFAVIKKMFDVNDKMKQTMGGIIGNSVKAIILICSMSAIVTVALSGSQILLNAMADAFDNADSQDITVTIEYDEEDYAAMLRSINTIANYSLNKHYDSRYNLNACYNDIREDLEYLTEKGKFKYPYRFDIIETTEEQQADGSVITVEKKTRTGEDTWQSVLYEIAAFDTGADVYLDSYDEARNETILYAMDVIRNKADFHALDKYTVTRYGDGQGEVAIDRMVMLLGTIDAADNSKYNTNMSFTDELRGQYLYGYKDIYDHSDMEAGFNYFIFVWHHILVIFIAILFLKQYLGMCFNAVARIFNMLFLYLVAPPFLAVMPLDDGGKAKQWTTAFIIQTFSLFGTVLSMRLFLVLIPIVVNSNVIFFPDDSKAQMLAQVIFLLGCAYVVSKAGGMITGILADNAGMQAISAGDMMAEASGVVDTAKGAITGAASFVGGQLMGIAGDVQGMMGGGGGGGEDGEGEGDGDAKVSTTESESVPASQNEQPEESQPPEEGKKPPAQTTNTGNTNSTNTPTNSTISPNTNANTNQLPAQQNTEAQESEDDAPDGNPQEPQADTDGIGSDNPDEKGSEESEQQLPEQQEQEPQADTEISGDADEDDGKEPDFNGEEPDEDGLGNIDGGGDAQIPTTGSEQVPSSQNEENGEKTTASTNSSNNSNSSNGSNNSNNSNNSNSSNSSKNSNNSYNPNNPNSSNSSNSSNSANTPYNSTISPGSGINKDNQIPAQQNNQSESDELQEPSADQDGIGGDMSSENQDVMQPETNTQSDQGDRGGDENQDDFEKSTEGQSMQEQSHSEMKMQQIPNEFNLGDNGEDM